MLLVFVMLAGVFTGCKKEEQVSTGPRKLTVGIPQDATIADYDSNGLAEYLKEITGIEIEWELFASGSSNYAQQLTLMCSSGEELPDVLIGFNDLGHYSVNQYGEDGYIIDLTDLILDIIFNIITIVRKSFFNLVKCKINHCYLR
jgi:ABC-type glycerol-3-phosphate transport system substrate-binding protein